MKTYLGEEGLEATWQEPFPKTMECPRCGGNCRIMFVAHEDFVQSVEDEHVCNLHENTGKKGGLRFHDAVAVAVYACQDCLKVTAVANQA